MTLAQKIKEIRFSKKLSLEDVAHAGGFARTLLWRVEHGLSVPRPVTFSKMLKGLGISAASKEGKEMQLLWGGARTDHSISHEEVSAGLNKVVAQKSKVMQEFLSDVENLSPDTFIELCKAVKRPAVLTGLKSLNALFEAR